MYAPGCHASHADRLRELRSVCRVADLLSSERFRRASQAHAVANGVVLHDLGVSTLVVSEAREERWWAGEIGREAFGRIEEDPVCIPVSRCGPVELVASTLTRVSVQAQRLVVLTLHQPVRHLLTHPTGYFDFTTK